MPSARASNKTHIKNVIKIAIGEVKKRKSRRRRRRRAVRRAVRGAEQLQLPMEQPTIKRTLDEEQNKLISNALLSSNVKMLKAINNLNVPTLRGENNELRHSTTATPAKPPKTSIKPPKTPIKPAKTPSKITDLAVEDMKDFLRGYRDKIPSKKPYSLERIDKLKDISNIKKLYRKTKAVLKSAGGGEEEDAPRINLFGDNYED